jgi:ubiquinone/menaquinone biosynthesis C-methylase UbiE
VAGRIDMARFQFMVLAFRVRDGLRPRREVLREVDIRPGFRVLDYGCGTGSYIRESARRVGAAGTVYALDVDPLAVRRAQRIAERNGLPNVRTILSDCATGLPDGSLDVVLLYDILHDLPNREAILRELHRVLKPDGILSVSDHHLRRPEIVGRVTAGGRFGRASKGRLTLGFRRLTAAC